MILDDLAVNAAIVVPRGLAVGPEGKLYMAGTSNRRIWQVSPPWPGFPLGDYTITSESGERIFYFEESGCHLHTLDAITCATLYSFNYSEAGLLDSIIDVNGHITHIEHDVDETPIAIIAPFGLEC